jgi:hypothetical protein
LYAAYRRKSSQKPHDNFYRFPYFLIASSEDFQRALIPRYRKPCVKLFSEMVGDDSTVHDDGGSSADADMHRYPFDTIGPLVSHVFPHFAIANAAQKFEKSRRGFQPFLKSAIAVLKKHANLDAVAAEKVLRRVVDLYSSWTSVIPDRTRTATDQNPSDDEGELEDDDWEDEETDYVGPDEPLPFHTSTYGGGAGTKSPRKAATKPARAGGASRTL